MARLASSQQVNTHDHQLIAYGQHAVEACLQHRRHRISHVTVRKAYHPCVSLAKARRIPYDIMMQDHDVCLWGTPERLLTFLDLKRKQWPEKASVLLLDGIQDPHNLGACIRSAFAFSMQAVISTQHASASVTAVVRAASAGTTEHIPIFMVSNMVQTMTFLKKQGFWHIGFCQQANTVLQHPVRLTMRHVLLFGGEHEGLSTRTQKVCDELIAIAIHPILDSLNVSVAVGIGAHAYAHHD
jgi:predicted rRNA methylase